MGVQGNDTQPFFITDKNKDSMDLEREIQIIALDIQQGKTDFVKGTKRILSLLSVVGQSEQYCGCDEIKVADYIDKKHCSYCDKPMKKW